MLKRIAMSLLISVFAGTLLIAQSIQIERVEPEFWWTGFQKSELQLLVYGDEIGSSRVTVDGEGVRLKRAVSTENPNYLFVYLEITEEAEPGVFELHFSKGDEGDYGQDPQPCRNTPLVYKRSANVGLGSRPGQSGKYKLSYRYPDGPLCIQI